MQSLIGIYFNSIRLGAANAASDFLKLLYERMREMKKLFACLLLCLLLLCAACTAKITAEVNEQLPTPAPLPTASAVPDVAPSPTPAPEPMQTSPQSEPQSESQSEPAATQDVNAGENNGVTDNAVSEGTVTEEFGHEYSYISCKKTDGEHDIKHTWKVTNPVDAPDPEWSEEWDGNTVTYTEIICEH